MSKNKTLKEWPMLYKQGAKSAQSWRIAVVHSAEHGCPAIMVEHGQVDGKKQQTLDPIREGKNAGRRNATTPEEQAIQEAEATWKEKQSRKGYALTLEGSLGKKLLLPMLAHPFQKHVKKVDWSAAVAQPKLDGYRCIAQRIGSTVSLTSKESLPIKTMAHIQNALLAYMKDGDIFDGELYIHGIPFEKIASYVKRKQDGSKDVQYHVYDFVQSNAYRDRYDALKRQIYGGQEEIALVPSVLVRNQDELMECQAQFIDDGYEGAMLRYGKSGYQSGKRTDVLLKVKTFVDEEFKVIDVKQGRGTHLGMAIFVCETRDGHFFDVLAPGTHSQKRAFWKNSDDYIGKHLTVKFQGYTKTETPVPFRLAAKAFADADFPSED